MTRILLALGIAAVIAVVAWRPAGASNHRPLEEPAAAPSPTISPEPEEEPHDAPPEDAFPEPEKPGFFDIVGRIRYAISQWFSNLVTSALEPVLGFLGRTVFATPPVASHERIVGLSALSMGIADAFLLLFLLFGAGVVTVGGGLASQLTAKELLPRLVVAAIAANVSLLLLRWLIDVSNALSRGVLGSLDPAEVARLMIHLLSNAVLGNPFLALLALALIVVAILVVITYVIRAAALVVLTAAAPLLLACHALPQTEAYAKAWWRAVLALLAAPVAQSMLLVTAFRVMLTPDGVLGLPIGSGFIDILVIGTLLYFLFKVPFWMLRAAFSSAGAKAAVSVKQVSRTMARAVTPS